VEAEDSGESGALRRLGRHVRWSLVVQGLALAAVGAFFVYQIQSNDWFGGTASAVYLVPWAAVLGGLWRSATGLLSR
jgi:hypothetical protein